MTTPEPPPVIDPLRRRVIVIGAASGIGAATAALFHANGHHVLAVDRSEQSVQATEYARVDLRDPLAIQRFAAEAGGGWDVLAHVAGVPGTRSADDVLTVNYLGFRLMAEAMLPRLREGGSIVAVASTAGLAWSQRADDLAGLLRCRTAAAVAEWQAGQDPNYPAYSTSKEALILFAKRLATTAWSEYRVRVNTISPGPVETPILDDFERSMGKEILDFARSTVGRHATVVDVAPVIAFLAAPESSWIIGQDIQVDGGFANSMVTAAVPTS